MTKQFLTGNQAAAYAALAAGVGVCAGYPGTPSSEVIETIAAARAAGSAHGVHVEWSTNEKAALELLAGASYAGARTLFTCKQVGLNVASDALMSLNYVGINGGCVLYVADDPGPISSQTEQDTRRFASFAKVPVFDPCSPEQSCEMVQVAFELSERYQTPVIVRPTTRVCHASTYVEVPEHTSAKPASGFTPSSRWVIFPKRAYEAHGEINTRLPNIANEFSGCINTTQSAEIPSEIAAGTPDGRAVETPDGLAATSLAHFNPITQTGAHPTLGIVAGGISYAYAREALRLLEQHHTLPPYKIMQVGTPYPFPQARVSAFAEGLSRIIVFEELDYVLEDELLRLAGRVHAPYTVYGKLSGHTTTRGENSIDAITEQLATFFGLGLQAKTASKVNAKIGDGAASGAAPTTNEAAVTAGMAVANGAAMTAGMAVANGAAVANGSAPTTNGAANGVAAATPNGVVTDEIAMTNGVVANVAAPAGNATLTAGGTATPSAGGAPAPTATPSAGGAPAPTAAPSAGGAPAPTAAPSAGGAPAPTAAPLAGLPAEPLANPTTEPPAGLPAEPPARPPLLCPGCPHRGSFFATKQALRTLPGRVKGIFCGDIGCYTLGNAEPLNAVDTCLCMGADITIAQGFSVAEPDKKALAFIGDSTFFASGMTGIANAVYNQHDITIVVLDNSTTAMTGSQPHPGTGVTLMGPKSTPISIEAVLRALGVTVITRANPLHLEEAVQAAARALEFNGPSAVIYQSPCVKLIKPARPVEVNTEACTGCGKCVLKLGCPALSWNADARHPVVDASLCNGCGLCTQVCTFGALTCPELNAGAAAVGAGAGTSAGVSAGVGASAGASAGLSVGADTSAGVGITPSTATTDNTVQTTDTTSPTGVASPIAATSPVATSAASPAPGLAGVTSPDGTTTPAAVDPGAAPNAATSSVTTKGEPHD